MATSSANGANRQDTADEPPAAPKDMPKAGWVEILKRSVKQFKHDDITDRAAALTYFGVLAIFPAMLVLVSVLGLLGKSTTQSVLDNLGQVAPGGVKSFLTGVIKQVQGKAGTAGLAAIIGILVALWSASGYVAAFMRASNAIYDVDEGRPIWKTAPVRLLTTLALVVMLVVSLVLVVVTGPIASQVGKAFGIGNTAVLIWNIAKWPVLLIVVSLMFSLLYKATPNVKQPKFRWVTPGGVLAVVVWLIASGPVRRVRRVLRLVQQDLRVAGDGDHLPGLAVDHEHRDPAGGRVQRRDAARAGDPGRHAGGPGAVRRAARHPQARRPAARGRRAREFGPSAHDDRPRSEGLTRTR